MGLSRFFQRKQSSVKLPRELLQAEEAAPSQPEGDSKTAALSPKSRLVAFLLCLFFGAAGAHRYYAGKRKSGTAMLLTGGGLGLWALFDLFQIVSGRFADASGAVISDWGLAKLAQAVVIRADGVDFAAVRGSRVVLSGRYAGDTSDPQALARLLQEALDSVPGNVKSLMVSLSTHDVLFRYFLIPNMPKSELESAVKFEARKYIPFKPDELVWDYQASPSAQKGKTDVVYAGVPLDSYANLIQALEMVGIKPSIIEPSTISLARLVDAREQGGNFVTVVDVGGSTVHIALVKNGVPYLSRDINLESRAVIAQEDEPLAAPAAETDPFAQRLISEIRVSTEFLMREYPGASLDKVILFGEEPVVRPWLKALSKELHCPAEMGRMALGGQAELGLPLTFATACGMLRSGGDVRRLPINLVRSHKKPASGGGSGLNLGAGVSMAEISKLAASINKPQAAIFAVLAIALLAGVGIYAAQWKSGLQAEYSAMMANPPAVGWGLSAASPEQLDEIAASVDRKIRIINYYTKEKASLAVKLDAIAKALPDGVWFNRMQFDERFAPASLKHEMFLAINGACFLGDGTQELAAIQEFETGLKNNPGFLAGFVSAKVDQITAEVDTTGKNEFRSFFLRAGSEEGS